MTQLTIDIVIATDDEAQRAAQALLDYADVNLTLMSGADHPTEGAERIRSAAQSLIRALSDEPGVPTPRQFAVQSAGYWYAAARRALNEGRPGEALIYMENAFNHTENALFALRHKAGTT